MGVRVKGIRDRDGSSAEVLVGGEENGGNSIKKAEYKGSPKSFDVGDSGSLEISFQVSGDDLLDYSDPFAHMLREDGLYSITLVIGPNGNLPQGFRFEVDLSIANKYTYGEATASTANPSPSCSTSLTWSVSAEEAGRQIMLGCRNSGSVTKTFQVRSLLICKLA